MPDEPNTNGAEAPRPTLRESIEKSWEQVVDSAPDESLPSQQPVDSEGQPRDEKGRWVAREGYQPGEAAEPEKTPPSPETEIPQAEPATQPRQGVAAAAPENWSAADREAFLSDDPERMRSFILRRHSEMESALQRNMQANAEAASFAQAVAPVFNDPEMALSLRQFGVTPAQAITEWSFFHKAMANPDLRIRQNAVMELMRRAQVDPAAFAPNRPEPVQLREGMADGNGSARGRE